MQFYGERRGILAGYSVEAASSAAAVVLGREALLAEYPATPRRRPLTLMERAERFGDRGTAGWVLYRIARDEEREPVGASAQRAGPPGDSG